MFCEVFHENPIFHFPSLFVLKQKVRCPNLGFQDFFGFGGFFIFGLLGAPFSNPTIGIKSYEDYLILGVVVEKWGMICKNQSSARFFMKTLSSIFLAFLG